LEPLTGGSWSSAYGFVGDGEELVVRFGNRSFFEIDQTAVAFRGPGLPVPKVVEIGETFGAGYAVSVRHFGRYLETVAPEESEVAGPTLMRLLTALYQVPTDPELAVDWYAKSPWPGLSWRGWLLGGLVDDSESTVSGWRATLAADARLDRLFRACESRIGELVEACPERRDLVHGDLLHGNVLVSADAGQVTAVFSWKCSARGDFLFDTAWCSFWGESFHPGIAATDPWRRIQLVPEIRADPSAFVDASARHHCYELQIGATHLGWHAWTGDNESLHAVAGHLETVLERGPRA
jgi:aminoglycoside phosphotransferase (APT) family kinase protein